MTDLKTERTHPILSSNGSMPKKVMIHPLKASP
uniref:Uncharacterized protein n=1 Tax=Anguilla anguilla TaxID=7936 RepID=A0A0E9SW24_ANGAN